LKGEVNDGVVTKSSAFDNPDRPATRRSRTSFEKLGGGDVPLR
jgi:hypothetical protein